VTACPFPHVPTLKVESRASRVIDGLGAEHILKNTRQTSWEKSPYANRSETAPYVIIHNT